jgi:hypothetical protein
MLIRVFCDQVKGHTSFLHGEISQLFFLDILAKRYEEGYKSTEEMSATALSFDVDSERYTC